MESECRIEGCRCLTAFAHAQVFTQQGTVVGMRAVFDDFMCALFGVFCSQVGDTLVGDEDVDRVLAMVCLLYTSDAADETHEG